VDTNAKTRIQGLQNKVLEAIATGTSLSAVAELICLRAEALAPTAICSILSVDRTRCLRALAAPSLPVAFSTAIDGLAIGPCVGSCGTAAYRGEPVEVTDIATDPLWAPYASALAVPLGLLACWSSPIKARDGQVTATFAFYYRTKRGPSDLERLIVEACVHLCTIALEQDEIQKHNDQLAHFDHLTGLPNRRRFNDLFHSRLDEGAAFGLLVADIDYLKTINDTMGHLVGDSAIQEVATRFRKLGQTATAFRLGGDEFALLVDGCRDHAALRETAGTVLAAMAAPFECDGNMIVPQVTIGGVVSGIDGIEAGVLRQNADFALYHAKEISRGGYCSFEQGLRTSITDRMQTIRDVDQALIDGRILAFYQPIVNLRTAEIVGLEALARMRTPDGRIISAGAFQAALSDPKVAYSLTDRMLAQVAHDVRSWIDLGIPFQHVGVNFSAADFSRDELENRLAAAFDVESVPLKHVILEVTETVHMGGLGNTIAKSIERLRSKGMLVALDDFGTGFASLTHLLSFPVDVIKIDKVFIDRLLTDRPSEIIVGSLIDLAARLDIKIVAEGIESAAQQERLLELGCTLGQGYHFARAADVATTTRLLQCFAQKNPSGASTALSARSAGVGSDCLKAS